MESRGKPAHRRRRWILVGSLLVGTLALGWGLRLLLQPERMGALIVAQAESATGLRFELDEPARLGIFPRLKLQLIGLSIRQSPQHSALLTAERVELALPLAVLWSSTPEIGRIDVVTPDINLPAVLEWLAVDESNSGPPEAISLPAFATEARISNGTLRAEGFALSDIELELSPLRDSTPATLSLAAEWQGDRESLPFQLISRATPEQTADGIRLRDLHIALSLRDEGEPLLSIAGETDLLPPQRITLALTATLSNPAQLSSTPLPPEITQLLSEPLTVAYDGAANFSAELTLRNENAETPIALSTRLSALLDWIANPERTLLPPAAGRLALPSLEVEGVRIEGLRVELTPDAPDPSSK